MMLFLFVQLFLRLDCQVAALFCLKSVTIIIYILKKVIPARALHKIILLPVVALAQSFKGCIPEQSASLLALSQAALQTGSRPPHPALGDLSLLSARLSPGQIM